MDIELSWTDFKTTVGTNKTRIRYVDRDTFYLLKFIDDTSSIFTTSILKDSGNDQTDFENNYQSLANTSYLAPQDTDGSPLARNKITKSGWHYQLHSVEFSSSKRAIDYSKNVSGSDIGFCTMKAYDDQDAEITSDENLVNAVKTIISWEPTHDYDIVGSFLFQLSTPTENLRMWCIGVPDVSSQYGGSKPFVEGGINLKFLDTNESLKVDGRAPKTMTYSSQYHTNKFSLIFKHPAGYTHSMMLVFELFKE